MSQVLCCFFSSCDLWNIVAGAVLSAIFTLLLIHWFRPRILIKIPKIDKDHQKIRMPVKNISKFSDAINVSIEAAFIDNGKTEHLEIDKDNFIILPKCCCIVDNDSERVFKTDKNFPLKRNSDESDEPYEKQKNNIFTKIVTPQTGTILRIRVYAQHAFTGFGKAFEAKFEFNGTSYIKK